jgi:hypothetical protein
MEVIEGAGHDAVRDRPEASLAAIRSFLAARPSGDCGTVDSPTRRQ